LAGISLPPSDGCLKRGDEAAMAHTIFYLQPVYMSKNSQDFQPHQAGRAAAKPAAQPAPSTGNLFLAVDRLLRQDDNLLHDLKDTEVQQYMQQTLKREVNIVVIRLRRAHLSNR
jgi:hypothetical protein